MSEVLKLVLTFFIMTEAQWTAFFCQWSSVIKLPVKRALWFSVHNWQVASCEYKEYCDIVLKTEVSSTKI